MSARYGSKTRSGEAVSDSGRRVTAGGSQTQYEQTFTAPGTWTWPGNVTHVEVLLVGGGGGSGSTSAPPRPAVYAGGGGGGGVRMVYDIPVSAPVPITVGAGGTAGTFPLGHGGAGGDSAFGPITPPIPPSTYKVGGGGGGASDGNGPPLGPVAGNAPADGGGAGGRSLRYNTGYLGGTYGMPSYNNVPVGTPTAPTQTDGGGAGALTSATYLFGGLGKWGYGFGGSISNRWQLGGALVPAAPPSPSELAGTANTGQGAGYETSYSTPGFAGGSGIVIVRWWE